MSKPIYKKLTPWQKQAVNDCYVNGTAKLDRQITALDISIRGLVNLHTIDNEKWYIGQLSHMFQIFSFLKWVKSTYELTPLTAVQHAIESAQTERKRESTIRSIATGIIEQTNADDTPRSERETTIPEITLIYHRKGGTLSEVRTRGSKTN